MPLVKFMSPTDPRIIQTVDAIASDVSQGGLLSNNLVYRYDVDKTDDGLGGEEGRPWPIYISAAMIAKFDSHQVCVQEHSASARMKNAGFRRCSACQWVIVL